MVKQRKTTLFSKPDEMEAAVSYQAMRLTWIVVNIVFIGAGIMFLMNGGQNPISLLALVAVEATYFIVKAFLSWRMTRGGADK